MGNNLNNNKSVLALIGAVSGFFITFFILGRLDSSFSGDIDAISFFICLPGAIVGALIGLASYKDEKKTEDEKGNPSSKVTKTDTVSKLQKYKELLDAGLITPEEYEKKKSETLNDFMD